MNGAGSNDPDARNAMRAFLQRSEVRLSTMHRIANAFLSGAGLLILFPVFYGGSINALIDWMAGKPLAYSEIPLLIALVITFIIPLWSLYLLVHDLTCFYFVGQQPGYHHSGIFNPTFSLSALALPGDECNSNNYKAQVIRDQYTEEFIPFVVPPSDSIASKDLDDLADAGFQPETRHLDYLRKQGIILEMVGDDPVFAENKRLNIKLFKRFNAALALAGLYDRPLHQEVAKIEASLVRHNIALRRIVIRYVKSLLTMVMLLLFAFVITRILGVTDRLFPEPVAGWPADELLVPVALMLWAAVAYKLVRMPIRWIYRMSDPRRVENSPQARDPSLKAFETRFRNLCGVVIVASVAYLVLRWFKL